MRILVTGAAGFIGTNLAISLKDNHELVLIDNFSRVGSTRNAKILTNLGLKTSNVDITAVKELYEFLDGRRGFDFLIHLAAQTSLLASIAEPKIDFDTNAIGTLNILEYLRTRMPFCRGIFLASNKIYGNLDQFEYIETPTRFQISNTKLDFDELLPIRPLGGYSISKSISDFYVLEYGRRYKLPIISLRQSAVYGQNQNPRSDQGWISYFVEQFNLNKKVKLRGNGKQVRDVLHIDDFCSLINKLLEVQFDVGEYYNVGGGLGNSLSILELFEILKELTNRNIGYEIGTMSVDDQKYFISDNQKISKLAKWRPTIAPETGIARLLSKIYTSS